MDPKSPADAIRPAIANADKGQAWAFRGLAGPKADVLAKIDADPQAPEPVKAYLKWLIEQLPCDGVKLDIFGHLVGAEFNAHEQIRKLY